MNENNRRLKRILLAACTALMFSLPFAGVPVVSPEYLPQEHSQSIVNNHPIAGTEPKSDLDGKDAACAGKDALKPTERISGGRGADGPTFLRAVQVNRQGFYYKHCTLFTHSDTPRSIGILSRASHGCRAPPLFSPQI